MFACESFLKEKQGEIVHRVSGLSNQERCCCASVAREGEKKGLLGASVRKCHLVLSLIL